MPIKLGCVTSQIGSSVPEQALSCYWLHSIRLVAWIDLCTGSFGFLVHPPIGCSQSHSIRLNNVIIMTAVIRINYLHRPEL
jgi:hypothetical protein